jgi:DNA-binding response OmpR family regulator
MTALKTIFLVEDDVELAKLTKERLEREGYNVLHEVDGAKACPQILQADPDCVILDVMLPGLDGFEVCRNIRPAYKGPILILTARDGDLDQILGLELGADDFVIKPVRPRVLLARIRALMRRADKVHEKRHGEPISVGELAIDPGRREARLAGVPVELTTVEFDLLCYLASNAGKVVSRNDIHLALYQTEYDGLDRSVDVYVSRLRGKLGDSTAKPRFLKTVRGTGYIFVGDRT